MSNLQKTLPLTDESRLVFDIEWVSRRALYLKGIGKICPVCNNHITGHPNKKYCSEKCSNKIYNDKYHKGSQAQVGLHAFIILKKVGGKNPYRIIKLYLKKGIVEQVKITPKTKELWNLLDKISEFRLNGTNGLTKVKINV